VIRSRSLPGGYRQVLAAPRVPALLVAFTVSYLGDAMSAVTIAWLAIEIAPRHDQSLYVGAAVAAFSLPGVIGALAFGRLLRRLPSRLLVVVDSTLRATLLGTISVLRAFDALSIQVYLVLVAVSSLLLAWGIAGRYTVLAELAGPDHTLAANSLLSSLASATVVIGPGVAGLLIAAWGAGPLIGIDAATYAVLAVVASRSAPPAPDQAAPAPVQTGKAVGGIKLLRRHRLIGVIALTWFFYFLYGPVEVALPLHISLDLHRGASLLGLYWALYGAGAAIGSLFAGLLRRLPIWPVAIVIVAGWGLCLVPFGFSTPIGLTVISFGVGGLIYGPYVPLTYQLMQARVAPHEQATVLATRGAIMTVAAPVGTVLGGPLTAALGAGRTLALSGLATVAAAVVIAALSAIGPARGQWSNAPPEPSPQ
jgi:predicted MFS family arabinose efflux permease